MPSMEHKKTRLNPFGQELSRETLEAQVDELLTENDRLARDLESTKATMTSQGTMLMLNTKKIEEQWAVIQALSLDRRNVLS